MEPDPKRHVVEACARPECLERVHDLLGDLWADAPDVPGADRIAFETAVAEIAANIVEHADGRDGAEVDLAVELRAYPDRVEASFRDTGDAVDVDVDAATMPDALAEGGRGMALARAAADEVVYERDGALNRWRVVRRIGR